MRPDIAEINKQKAAERSTKTAEVKAKLKGPAKEIGEHIESLPNKADRDKLTRLTSALFKFIG